MNYTTEYFANLEYVLNRINREAEELRFVSLKNEESRKKGKENHILILDTGFCFREIWMFISFVFLLFNGELKK